MAIRGKIRRYSKKRAKKIAKYSKERVEFIENERKCGSGIIRCIFCGDEIIGEPDLHHGMGRDGDLLLDTEHWTLAHTKCHWLYHNMEWKKLPWWWGYMTRIQIKRPQIYNKEQLKMSKK